MSVVTLFVENVKRVEIGAKIYNIDIEELLKALNNS